MRASHLALGAVSLLLSLEVVGRLWLPTQANAPGFRGLGDHARLVATLEGNAWRIRDDAWDIPNAYDPELGWTNAPGAWPHPEGFPETVNAQGWHATRPYPPEPPQGQLRVGCFGDSFTYGSDARDGEPWPNQLHALLPEVDVLNLGVPGYGHDQIGLLAERVAGELSVDIALFGYTAADEHRNEMDVYGWPKPRFLLEPPTDPSGTLRLQGPPLPRLADLLEAYERRPRAWDLLTIAREGLTPGPPPEATDALALALLRRFVSAVEAQGITPVIVHVPGAGPQGPAAPSNALRRACEEGLAPCIDPHDRLLEAYRAGVPLPGPLSHLSPEAYALIAEEVAEGLRALDLLPAGQPPALDQEAAP